MERAIRTNFGRVSGVIVDVCRAHGTWFDGTELTRVIGFASTGGLAKAQAAAQREKEEAKSRAAQNHAAFLSSPSESGDRFTHDALEVWRDILRSLL